MTRYALLSRDPALVAQVTESLHPLCPQLCVFTDELDVLRALRHYACELILFDANCASPLDSAVLAWQNCHRGRPIPLIVIGRFLDCTAIFDWYRAGALDVLSIPFDNNELHVRATLATRRRDPAAKDDQQIVLGPYRLDRATSMTYLHDEPIKLTARECCIAWLLFSNPGVCLRRCQLAKTIWGNNSDFTDRTLEQHIYKLRKKLRLCSSGSVRIHTIYAHGYRLELSGGDGATESSMPAACAGAYAPSRNAPALPSRVGA
ncbi:winged helix-turn-helix transcriptional regulator [Xanthomonas theicola]|uniref:Two-component system response regulator protein HrpG n=1 Tax=Xanthomonas theicola TaxID=56464 RepID=A0A2S6ZJ93_9XANT|nr:response regulator transcription factor [Xanthomonas theicola]PPT92331.1 two-component system response regulator protein HrpG [Xanthomonas theicola]QNH23674.1 response regulator transcription factor [Xanthomonas theicola]